MKVFYICSKQKNNTMEVNQQTSQQGFPPKSWLVESILVTIFCCQILGIIGIINAASVESKFYRGDIAGAESASRTAKQMLIWSVVSGVLIIGLIVLIYGGLIFGALASGSYH